MPRGYGQLAGDQGSAAVVPIVKNFQDIPASLGTRRGDTPIINDQQLGLSVVF